MNALEIISLDLETNSYVFDPLQGARVQFDGFRDVPIQQHKFLSMNTIKNVPGINGIYAVLHEDAKRIQPFTVPEDDPYLLNWGYHIAKKIKSERNLDNMGYDEMLTIIHDTSDLREFFLMFFSEKEIDLEKLDDLYWKAITREFLKKSGIQTGDENELRRRVMGMRLLSYAWLWLSKIKFV